MEYLIGSIYTLIALCLIALGFALGETHVKDDCDIFGKVQIQKTVYICTLETKNENASPH